MNKRMQEHDRMHCWRMMEILVSVWCRTSEQLGLESTTSKVDVDDTHSEFISYTEKFGMCLSRHHNNSSLFEITCKASKRSPSIYARVTFQSKVMNELDALRLANSINKNSPCAVSVVEAGNFQVCSSVSYSGYFDVENPLLDFPTPQEESTMNMFADLLSTTWALYEATINQLVQATKIHEDTSN